MAIQQKKALPNHSIVTNETKQESRSQTEWADLKKKAAVFDVYYWSIYLQSATSMVNAAQTEVASIYGNPYMNQTQQNEAADSVRSRLGRHLQWLTYAAEELNNRPVDTEVFTLMAPVEPDKSSTNISYDSITSPSIH